MSSNTQVMVPGILIALKTHVYGGVQYERRDLDGDDEGTVKTWETTRRMEDPAEHQAAQETAGKVSRMVSRLCIRTSFGLLCPAEREAELDEAVAQMRQLVRDWNANAKHSFINASTIKGRIADNDEEAIRAILEEARELLDRMDRGLDDSDVKLIRDAAQRAKRLSDMMTPETSGSVYAAVAAAREAAKAIVKRGEAVGDAISNALIDAETVAFQSARFSFLDTMETTMEALPSVNLQRGAELEVDVDAAEEVA